MLIKKYQISIFKIKYFIYSILIFLILYFLSQKTSIGNKLKLIIFIELFFLAALYYKDILINKGIGYYSILLISQIYIVTNIYYYHIHVIIYYWLALIICTIFLFKDPLRIIFYLIFPHLLSTLKKEYKALARIALILVIGYLLNINLFDFREIRIFYNIYIFINSLLIIIFLNQVIYLINLTTDKYNNKYINFTSKLILTNQISCLTIFSILLVITGFVNQSEKLSYSYFIYQQLSFTLFLNVLLLLMINIFIKKEKCNAI